jgi:hypothetical protein
MDTSWIRYDSVPEGRTRTNQRTPKKRSLRKLLPLLLIPTMALLTPSSLEQRTEDPLPIETPTPYKQPINISNAIYASAFEQSAKQEITNSFNRYAWGLRFSRGTRYRDYLEETKNPDLIEAIFIYEAYANPRKIGPTDDAGLGMFIPDTAKMHGLTRDKFFDERLSPKKSILAIDNRIEFLRERYGDDPVKILVTYTKGKNFQREKLSELEGQELLDFLEEIGITYHLKAGQFIPMKDMLDFKQQPLHSQTPLVEVKVEKSLWQTAQAHGVSICEILEHNHLIDPSIYPKGMTLKIPVGD